MRLLPRNLQFYDLLDRQADNLEHMASRFVDMLHNFQDLESRQAELKNLEHVGDDITHQLSRMMHATFVTPLDKEDIAALYAGLDDVADYIDAAADRLVIYHIQQPTAEAIELGDLLQETVQQIALAVRQMRSLKKRDLLFEIFRAIHTLENRSDAVYRRALGDLFNEPNADPVKILKWKEIYERMERAVDECEDVANVIESIVLKYG